MTTIEILKDQLRDLLAITEINDADTLQSIGTDSIDMIEVFCIIEDEFGVEISNTEISLESTVAAVAALIESRKETTV